MNHLCGVIAATMLLSPVLAPAQEPPAESDRPNLIFLLADDQRYDTLGCNGNPIIQTPHLDRLAARGVSFDQAYVTTSICMTSRASIMTGQHARVHGINSFGRQLTREQLEQTYYVRLRQAGYHVGFVGKWGVGSPPQDVFDYNRGYDGQGSYYEGGEGKHLTARMADQAEEFIATAPADRPFCLSVSFKAPHVDASSSWQPFAYDKELAELYAEAVIPAPPLDSVEFFESLPRVLRESENRIRWRERFATAADYQESVKSYYRLVTGMDRAVGRVVKAVADRGLSKKTVVVFTSDHGFYLGERGFAGKWYPHEVSIRIPLIIADPRNHSAQGGERVEAIALNIDMAPTLLDLAGVPVPDEMQGASLAPLLGGSIPADWRRDFYYEHTFDYATIPKSEAIRFGHMKYLRFPEANPPIEELYDLHSDPDEMHNLADLAEKANLLNEMRARLNASREKAEGSPSKGSFQKAEADDRIKLGRLRPVEAKH